MSVTQVLTLSNSVQTFAVLRFKNGIRDISAAVHELKPQVGFLSSWFGEPESSSYQITIAHDGRLVYTSNFSKEDAYAVMNCVQAQVYHLAESDPTPSSTAQQKQPVEDDDADESVSEESLSDEDSD